MFICSACGKKEKEESLLWRCSCGGPFLWNFSGKVLPTKDKIISSEHGMWRYIPMLPLERPAERVSLGEEWTPLVKEDWNGLNLCFKLDFTCPTGSYKDRGMACLVSRLRELGVSEVVEDSSGNAGASMAAYCARAGIRCHVFVPEYTSEGKCIQIVSHGAELVRIPGTREDTTKAAEAIASETYYASHNWNPYFAHGVKTFAFEIWEQLGFQPPDSVLLPAGQGSLVLGWALAFEELFACGEINVLPKIYALQPQNCAPLEEAFRLGAEIPLKVEKKETMAEGISSAEPVRGREVLAAVRRSGGAVFSFSEKEIWNGFLRLSQRGYFVEPTSAITAAAADRLSNNGVLEQGQTVVAILTGSGLKGSEKILSLFSHPPLE